MLGAGLTWPGCGHTTVMERIDGVWRGDELDDDADPVMGLWRLRNEARTTKGPRPTSGEPDG